MSRSQNLFGAQKTVAKPDTVNRAGYPAYTRSIEERYVQTLFTNTLGNTYYASSKDLLEDADAIHDEMLKKDPEFAAKAIVAARNQGFMRLQPIYGLAKLSAVNTQLFSRIFRRVILIPSDLADFLTIMEGIGRGQGGRAVKAAIAGFLNDITEYWAIKYSGRARGFNLADAIRTAHPKPKDAKQQALFRYVLKLDTDMSLIPQVAAYEQLRHAETPSERVEAIRRGHLPHEVVTSVTQMDKPVWEAVLREMPTFALLRHLNALDDAGVLDKNRDFVTERLTDKEALIKSKILPFRFATAYRQVKKPWVKDVLREAAERSFDNLPKIEGRTLIALDISGSMDGQYLEIGSVFAFALYKKTQGHSLFYLFDTRAEDANPSMHDSILSQASRIRARGGTNTGTPLEKLMQDGEKVDNIILITDEQQNAGSPFYNKLLQYRRQFNKNAKAFIVDISPYGRAMVPQDDPNTFYIYGWSDTVLDFISLGSRGFSSMVDTVSTIRL